MVRKKKTWTMLAGLVLYGLSASMAYAIVIAVDPDDFIDGTDISNAFPGITLSAIDGGNNILLTPSVFSQTSSLASTGTQVFGHDGIFTTSWARSLLGDLRVDFAQPTDFVSIDIVANDNFDPGFIQAFDTFDTLLGSFTTAGNLGVGVVETASISTGTANIAYVVASGIQPEDVVLDNLQFNRVDAIAEPGTVALIGIGLVVVALNRRREPSS